MIQLFFWLICVLIIVAFWRIFVPLAVVAALLFALFLGWGYWMYNHEEAANRERQEAYELQQSHEQNLAAARAQAASEAAITTAKEAENDRYAAAAVAAGPMNAEAAKALGLNSGDK